MPTEAPPDRIANRLAWASIVAIALAWLPIAILAINDPFDPKPRNEISGWAATAAVLFGIGLLCCIALVGVVLATIALSRQSRHRVARTGLVLNALPLVGAMGIAIWLWSQ